jgi:glycogen(starch) synthase
MARTRALVPEITPYSSVLYNGLEEPCVEPAPLPLDSPRLLCIARLAPEKGVDLALRAFVRVRTEFPRARLTVAGNGACRDELENEARTLGIADAVDFLGWIDPHRVPALINRATLVILPSRLEALPSVALEAGIMARPVVAARVGGVPEIVVDRETGLLVEANDDRALAHAIGDLLRQPAIACGFGSAARRRIRALFGFDRYVEGYDSLYRKVGGVLSPGALEGTGRGAASKQERPT